jgi:hypothetical protein
LVKLCLAPAAADACVVSCTIKEESFLLYLRIEVIRMRLSQDYIDWIRAIRKGKELHNYVENRLKEILSKILPEYHAVKEPQALAGGRNDLMLFEFSGRKVLFEIFATKSQVSRDLRILDKTKADVKIAIVIDKEIDPKVFERFIRENPEDNYPFIFVGELFEKGLSQICPFKLLELIKGDEEAKFQRILNQRISTQQVRDMWNLDGIDILSVDDIENRTWTIRGVIVFLVVNRLFDFGITRDKIEKIARWLSDKEVIESILTRINFGLNLFLETDFEDNCEIYADIDVVDWLIIGHKSPKPRLLLSMNSVIDEVFDKYFEPKTGFEFNRNVTTSAGLSVILERGDGREVTLSLPKNTKSITIYRPFMTKDEQVLSEHEYLKMIKFI